jgi:hypothetical protein
MQQLLFNNFVSTLNKSSKYHDEYEEHEVRKKLAFLRVLRGDIAVHPFVLVTQLSFHPETDVSGWKQLRKFICMK